MANDLNSIDKQIAELQAKKKAILDEQRDSKLQEVKAIVNQFSFTASDLGLLKGKKKAVVQKAALEPMYANPKNPKETWHGGRGAQPKWIKEFLAAGGNLEKIKIKK